MYKIPDQAVLKFVRRLMPNAGETEVREATETFKQYAAIVRRIYERVEREKTRADSHNCVS